MHKYTTDELVAQKPSLDEFKKTSKPIPRSEFFETQLKKLRNKFGQKINLEFIKSSSEITKKIAMNSFGEIGLRDWPEIKPRGVKDKAYIVFKKEGKPLHFNQVTEEIKKSGLGEMVFVQTVHNELIKDPRFILVGRGIYALSEWGYYPGQVKDVISKIIKEERKPLTKEEILEKVLKQRLVKENTILLNLSNKKYFLRNPQGKYTVREI